MCVGRPFLQGGSLPPFQRWSELIFGIPPGGVQPLLSCSLDPLGLGPLGFDPLGLGPLSLSLSLGLSLSLSLGLSLSLSLSLSFQETFRLVVLIPGYQYFPMGGRWRSLL